MPRPRKQTSLDKPALTQDGWQNLLTGVGVAAKDKRRSSNPYTLLLSYDDCRTLYGGNAMAELIVNTPADDLVRKWFEVSLKGEDTEPGATPREKAEASKATREAQEAITTKLDELNAPVRFRDACRQRRAYGGAGIFMGINDGVGLDKLFEPVRENAIRSVDYLTTLDANELQVVDYYTNPLAAKFGEPKTFQLQPSALGVSESQALGAVKVHESRIIRFCGPLASRRDLLRNQGWGDPILARAYAAIQAFDGGFDGAGALIQDFAQAVFKIKGLADAVAADRSEVIIARLKLMDLSRSYLRGIALDAESEDFERKPTPLAGLPDLLDRLCNRLAAVAGMPVSMLMGQAPAGLNATGSENTRYYYDKIAAAQGTDVRPQANKLVRAILLSKEGPTKGKEPDVWSISFNPLWELSETEQATVRKTNAETDNLEILNGVISPEEVRQSRHGGDGYGSEITLDNEAALAYESTPDPEETEDGEAAPEETDPEETDPEETEGKAAPKLPGKAAPKLPGKAVPALPGAPAPAPEAKAQDTALNGAQVTSALEIVKAVASEELPRDSGVAMLIAFFNLPADEAESVMGTVGKGFVPKPPPAPIMPGAGGPPPPPGVKPNGLPKPGAPAPKLPNPNDK